MKPLVRFGVLAPHSPEGRLLAAGRAEEPSPLALQRVARRLGTSAVAFGVASTTAAASAATTATASTATTATAGSTAAASAGVAAAPAVITPLLSITFIKAAAIGVGLGAGVLGTVELAKLETHSHIESAPPRAEERSESVQRMPSHGARGRSTLNQPAPALTVNALAGGLSTELPAGSDERQRDPSSPTTSLVRPVQAQLREPLHLSASDPLNGTDRGQVAGAVAVESPGRPSDEELANEVVVLDAARSAISRGAATLALQTLAEYEGSHRFLALEREAMLVRIEALLSVDRRAEASVIARRLLDIGAPATQRARLETLARSPQ